MIAEALAAAAHRLGEERDAVLARIGGPIGRAARRLPTPDQRTRAEWAARARAQVPAGFRAIDPTWIEAALAELPDRARAALGGDATAPVDVWLARWATAGFVALPPTRPLRTPDDVEALAPDAAERWLASVGLDQLAHALAGQPIALLADVRERIARPPRAGQLGPQRAAIERCAGLVPSVDHDALVEVGARTVAPYVPALARIALAIRMPRVRGARVLAAFAAHARDPLDRSPSWAALIA